MYETVGLENDIFEPLILIFPEAYPEGFAWAQAFFAPLTFFLCKPRTKANPTLPHLRVFISTVNLSRQYAQTITFSSKHTLIFFSLPFSAKQKLDMTKFCVVWRTWTTTAFLQTSISNLKLCSIFSSEKAFTEINVVNDLRKIVSFVGRIYSLFVGVVTRDYLRINMIKTPF